MLKLIGRTITIEILIILLDLLSSYINYDTVIVYIIRAMVNENYII